MTLPSYKSVSNITLSFVFLSYLLGIIYILFVNTYFVGYPREVEDQLSLAIEYIFIFLNGVGFLYHLGLLINGLITKISKGEKIRRALMGLAIIIAIPLIAYIRAITMFRDTPQGFDKPVIYIYPAETQKVSVALDFKGDFKTVYPSFTNDKDTWEVMAQPNGTLRLPNNDRDYGYLFWEGKTAEPFNITSGFVVAKADTKQFLEWALREQGLNDKEANDFIVYWLPQLEENPYNLIHFSTDEYQNIAKLTVTPKPDSIIRVFMVYKPLSERVSFPEQKLEKIERSGFTVVEWGGSNQSTNLIK
jgi:hypothetical protein